MIDKYVRWHNTKGFVDNRKSVFFKERQVWFCYLGNNIGYEQNGSGKDYLRPVLVIKKFNNRLCLVVPLTKKIRDNRFNFIFQYVSEHMSSAIFSQIRLVDSKRLKYLSGYISEKDFIKLKRKTRDLIL